MSVSRPVVDADCHVWDPSRDDNETSRIPLDISGKSFTPHDLRPWLAAAGVDFIVLVQTASSVEETCRLLAIAEATEFVAGVVGWVGLAYPDVEARLAELRSRPDGQWLVGIRHPVHDEQDAEWFLQPHVQRGLAAVRDAGLVYDFLVTPRELPAALATARAFPDMRFVVGNLGKPPMTSGEIDVWSGLLEPFRGLRNVSCKINGTVTEAGWTDWAPTHLRPYVRIALDVFGTKRVMYGSDWPAVPLAESYGVVKQALEEALPRLAPDDWAMVFGGNAIDVYQLPLV
jgi:L-fuconolactonase